MKTLTVENLPNDTTVPELVSLFQPFGWVAGVDMKKGNNGQIGKVDLAWGSDLALRFLNGTLYKGRPLVVRLESQYAMAR